MLHIVSDLSVSFNLDLSVSLHTDMARPQDKPGSISRYSTRTKLSTKTRIPWRHRTQWQALKRTSAQKKQLAKQRRDNKERYNNALEDAFQVLVGEACKLREEFGAHSEQYYLEELLKRPKVAQRSRGINRWNVFVREEVKRLNDGELQLRFMILHGVY